MAEKKTTENEIKVTNPEAPRAAGLVSGGEAQKAADAFYKGELEPGFAIRFETRGGETVPVVRKLK